MEYTCHNSSTINKYRLTTGVEIGTDTIAASPTDVIVYIDNIKIYLTD